MPIDDQIEKLRIADELKQLEELQRKAHEYKLQIENLTREVEHYQNFLISKDKEKQVQLIKAHLKGLSNFWPLNNSLNELDKAICNFVTNPEFPEIYKNALILSNQLDRIEYISMKAIQLELNPTSDDALQFYAKLAPLGLNLVCPYFKYDPDFSKRNILDQCTIDGEEVNTTCNGRYDICVIFKDRTSKFATQELPLQKPFVHFNTPSIKISDDEKSDLEYKLKEEIDKYWRDEA
ncbi:hypothetical protein J4471_00050 [Candidatus Woesearchaeota archaeon]|nr:hypothetical protein [Candidatus Woesearchaeota archaeon]